MKLYISENIDKAIQGFNIIPIVYGSVDLGNVPDNSASTIVATDAIDSIPCSKIETFLDLIVKKLRMDGELYLGGTDVYALSRFLLNGEIDAVVYNEIAENKQSMYSAKEMTDLLHSHNLAIQSTVFKGYNYEIISKRPSKNKN